MASLIITLVVSFLCVANVHAKPSIVSSSHLFDYSKCLVAEADGHPEVDLNELATSSDRTFESKSGSKYVYHLNICGETKFQDSICGEGASVCEVQDEDKGLDTYGYLDTISVEWDHDALKMTMTGTDPCPYLKSKPYTTTILFSCDEADEEVTLTKEDFYQCSLEFSVKTSVACGGPAKKYKCDDTRHQCVADENGEYPNAGACLDACKTHYVCSSEEKCELRQGSGGFANYTQCEASCGVAHHFACDTESGGCKLDANGPYPNINDCSKSCTAGGGKYNCDEKTFKCEEAKDGQYNITDCRANCAPWVKHYTCFNNKCESDSKGKFTGLDECEAACGKTIEAWSCIDSVCTEDEKGTYKTEAECQTACGETKYHCDNGKCVESSSGSTKEVCEAACGFEKKSEGLLMTP